MAGMLLSARNFLALFPLMLEDGRCSKSSRFNKTILSRMRRRSIEEGEGYFTFVASPSLMMLLFLMPVVVLMLLLIVWWRLSVSELIQPVMVAVSVFAFCIANDCKEKGCAEDSTLCLVALVDF